MKNFFKILSKTILMLVIFCLLWFSLSDYFRTDKVIYGDQFRLMPEDSTDIIALGSSHMQYSVNPAVIYNTSGYYTYDLGSSCQEMSMSYYFLKEALKTQNPEVVLIDVFTLLPAHSVCYSDGMYYVATQQLTGWNKIEATNSIPNTKVKYNYMFDLIMNHSNWKTMDLSKKKTELTYNKDLGYVQEKPSDFEFHHLVQYDTSEKIELDDNSKKILDSIQQLCDENNIHLIFFKSPFDCDQENHDNLQAVWDYMDKQGMEYIDFIEKAEELGFTLGMDGDTWHCNTWGAEKVSSYLASYIEKKGYITHHQSNEVYETLLAGLEQRTSDILLEEEQVDIYSLLNFSKEYPCIKLIRYNGSDNTSIGDYENRLLKENGFQHDFINNSSEDYYALIENNTVIQESSSPFSMTYQGHQIEFTENSIQIDGIVQDEDSEMTIIFTNQSFSQFNVMPIDYASRFFWKNGCDGWTCSSD